MLGASAAKLAAEGKPEKAKELCYKALANDEDAAEALYELGKIFEKEGKSTAAGDFLVRAAAAVRQGRGRQSRLPQQAAGCGAAGQDGSIRTPSVLRT